MGLFDSIKDALTTDDAEQYEASQKALAKAQADFDRVKQEVGTRADPASRAKLDGAERAVTEARTRVDELAAKAGLNHPDPAADATAAQAQADADADADAQAQRDADAVARMKERQARYAEEQAAQAAPSAAPAEAAPAEQAAPAEPPAPAEPAPPAAEPQYREYTVVKGDTLSEIGQRFGVKWRDIAALNNIKNPDLIHPGEVFRIPNA